MSIERRNAPRVRAYRPVRIVKPGTSHVVETLTKDIGMGGVRCISPGLFPVSSEVSVEVVLSTGEEPFTVRGRAIWFQTIPHSEQFDIGIAFLELPAQSKRRLSVYIDRLSSKLPHVTA